MGPARRIAAIVLPQLACELVRQRGPISPSGKAPLAVILEDDVKAARAPAEAASSTPPLPAPSWAQALPATAVIHVVDDEARRYGVRPGQQIAEAAALVAHLAVHRVSFAEIDAALGRVAEVALALGPTAAIRLGARIEPGDRNPWGRGPYDTVWLDITGAAHLVGGEEALCDELGERVAALGHRARIAIADGPRLAQALARWGMIAGGADPSRRTIAPEGRGGEAIAPLPVQALPLDPEVTSFLVRVGLLRVGDLARLPKAAVAARLGVGRSSAGAHRDAGRTAAEVMALVAGYDPAPLVPFEPPRVLEEWTRFEDSVESAEALLFVLRGMTSRVASRLAARGEACRRIEVAIAYDRSIARLRLADRSEEGGAPPRRAGEEEDEEGLRFHVELPALLSDQTDLLRPLKAKLEQIELLAPAVGLRLVAAHIAPARQVQLDLSRDRSVDPDTLPALLAELSAEIGAERVGVLEIVDAHRPEARSRLVPVQEAQRRAPGGTPAQEDPAAREEPSRLLPKPIPLGRVGRGAIVAVDRQLFAIERMRFVMRLDGVEWWTASPASRDYVRAWLVAGPSKGAQASEHPSRAPRGAAEASPSPAGEAWIYVDRTTGEAFLQGWCE